MENTQKIKNYVKWKIKKNKKEVQNQWDSCQKPNSLKKFIEVHLYCIFTTHLMSICEKKRLVDSCRKMAL